MENKDGNKKPESLADSSELVVHLSDASFGRFFAIVFLMSLCVVMVWFSFFKTHNPAMQIFGSFFLRHFVFWLFFGLSQFP